MSKQSINEKDDKDVIESWYDEAKGMSLDNLPDFLKKLTEDYGHDYGTICHAITAGSIATANAINHSPTGGITGFQASCIMWEFISRWMGYENEPLRLVKYDDMLYPQYDEEFDKTISSDTWKYLQDEAKEKLSKYEHEIVEKKGELPLMSSDVLAHWKSIVDGNVPFGYTIKDEK